MGSSSLDEVRIHRQQIGDNISPSAHLSADEFAKTAGELIRNKFFQTDYADTTLKLIATPVSYETVAKSYKYLIEQLFS